MAQLRFRGVDQNGERGASPVLAFPGAVRDVLTRPDPRLMSQDQLADSMEATLQRMEASLDLLRRESGAIPMPGFSDNDDPPRAA